MTSPIYKPPRTPFNDRRAARGEKPVVPVHTGRSAMTPFNGLRQSSNLNNKERSSRGATERSLLTNFGEQL